MATGIHRQIQFNTPLRGTQIKTVLSIALIWMLTISSGAIASGKKHGGWPPPGNILSLEVTRDTSLSSVGDERFGNNGKSGKLKLKGRQEYTLIDFDPSVLRGKLVTGALLHFRSASPDKAPLSRVGISTVASEWVEGSTSGYRSKVGAASFDQSSYQRTDWAYKGSSLMDIVFGKGHTLWKFAESSPPDRKGWQTCAVSPDVIAARISGISHGLCLYDEVGSTWSMQEGNFEYTYFPNRFFYSRESGKSAPWLEIWVSETDRIPPDSVTSISCTTENLPAGQAILEWETPADHGGGHATGFYIRYVSNKKIVEVPRYLIPAAGKSGEKVRMLLRDLPLKPGQELSLFVRTVDSAGNIGEPYIQPISVSSGTKWPDFLLDEETEHQVAMEPIGVGDLEISVLSVLEKVDPVTGKVIPTPANGQHTGNHLFSKKNEQIKLYSAGNETIWFQINAAGRAKDISAALSFNDHPNIKPRFYQFGYVNVKGGKKLPDPLLVTDGHISLPSSAGRVRVDGQQYHSLVCEIYVPHEELSGKKTGKLRLYVDSEVLELDVELNVWNFTLPDKLSFIPEMNAYSGSTSANVVEYYRLAHEHRTCFNRLPYGWSGNPSSAPEWNGTDFKWARWEKTVASLLDGSAFKGLPRDGEPVDVFYLPFNENWPVSVSDHYQCSYWADEAFTKAYPEELHKAFAAFAEHCAQKKWGDTIFQFYLNNKVTNRKSSPRNSAPWIFDEPINTQDFWALRWYGLLWQNAVKPYKGSVKLWYRSDISYSQFERNMLLGLMDVEYLGGNNAQKTRMKHDEQVLYGKSYYAEYGTANSIEEANTQPVLWCLSAWANGAMGVLPWQTVGDENAWISAQQTALFYPAEGAPIPSVRLKAFTYGQQLVEYLTLFSQAYDLPHHAVVEWLEKTIELKGDVVRHSNTDAGMIHFQQAGVTLLSRLRYALGEMISKKEPPYKRSLIDFESPEFDPASLPNIGYVTPAPAVSSLKPECNGFLLH